MKKNEILIYTAVAFIVLFISAYVVISSFMDRPVESSSNKEYLLAGGIKKPDKRKRRKWKNHFPRNRDKKFFIPEGINIDEVDARIRKAGSNHEKVMCLRELYGTKHEKILEIVDRELDNPDEDVRMEALDLLSEFGTEEIFDNLSKALDDESADIRETAIDLLDTVEIKGGSEFEADLISKGLNDESEDVRDSALNILSDKPTFELEIVAKTAMKSSYDSVKEDVLDELSNRPSQIGVEIMIEGLLDKNIEFREEVKEDLEYITDKEFSSYKEAKAWWSKNKSRFEEEFAEDED
jgi:HEAT repeat protein